MSDLPEYRLERSFDAPPQMVWRTWTEAPLLSRWYGPGVETIIHELDVRPGGLWKNEMRLPQGSGFQRTEFTEVDAPHRFEAIMSTANADWEIEAMARMPDWPRSLLTTVTLEAQGEGTKMTLIWTPHEASEAETACFAGAASGMGKGWEAGVAGLDDVLC